MSSEPDQKKVSVRIVIGFVVVLGVLATGWTKGSAKGDPSSIALSKAGYTSVTMTGYRAFGCGDADTLLVGFAGVNASSQKVTGVVCSGWGNTWTIHLD